MRRAKATRTNRGLSGVQRLREGMVIATPAPSGLESCVRCACTATILMFMREVAPLHADSLASNSFNTIGLLLPRLHVMQICYKT